MSAEANRFVGTGPGENLDALLSRVSLDDVQKIVGDEIIALVDALKGAGDRTATLRRIASGMLRDRAEEYFARREVRTICLSALSYEKQNELAARIGAANDDELRGLDPTQDIDKWNSFLGFFGIDTRGAVPYAAEPDQERIRPQYGLFPHQRKAADRVLARLRGNRGRVILHMPTGAGKTRTAMHVVSRFLTSSEPAVIVWLAGSAELLEQAAEALQDSWTTLGNREIEILRFWGKHTPDLSDLTDGVVIAGFQKVHALRTKEPLALMRFGKGVSLVVVDEAHQAIAPTYRALIETLVDTGSGNALVGLTATPGRTWADIAADEELSEFFGGQKVMLEIEGWDDPVAYLMDEGYLARPTFRNLTYESTPDLTDRLKVAVQAEDDFSSEALEALANEVNRNVVIIDEVKRLIDVGHSRIILFGASVHHAQLLAAALSACEIDARVVTGNTATTVRSRIIKAFRGQTSQPMVLCNFGVLTTGFDAPNTSAAIVARPTRSLVLFSQMVGRATRGPKAGGNETCEVSTVVDVDLAGFGNVGEAFMNWEDVWNGP